MKLRSYQKQGVQNILKAWEIFDLVMFVLCTGGGKTVTFVEIIRSAVLEGKRVLLIAHRKELILQAWKTLYKSFIFAGVIMAGFPEKPELPVQVCSIQTIAGRKHLPEADVLIIDEAHHVTKENTYSKIIARYSNAKILLVTATPYRLSGEGFRYLTTKETGLVINRTLSQLIDEGWLVPIEFYAASIPDFSNVAISKGDYSEKESHEAMKFAPLVESYREHANGKKGIVFAINIEHSIQIAAQYNEAGIPAAHLDGETPTEERSRILHEFETGKIMVIVNVGIVTEGYDFPQLEFVQLARRTKSLNLYLQMVGRVTRALSGLLDGIDSIEERKAAIAGSAKPCGIVLDNAGCWMEHLLPTHEHDWNRFFLGAKKAKPEPAETMEILVFVAEDSAGNQKRTTKPEEIAGMKLVNISSENSRTLVNIVSLREFDRLFAIFKRKPNVKKPGYVAFISFKEYCNRNRFLMTDEVWSYLRRVLIDDIETKVANMEKALQEPNVLPAVVLKTEIEKVKLQGVASGYLKAERTKYEKANFDAVLKSRFGNKAEIAI